MSYQKPPGIGFYVTYLFEMSCGHTFWKVRFGQIYIFIMKIVVKKEISTQLDVLQTKFLNTS